MWIRLQSFYRRWRQCGRSFACSGGSGLRFPGRWGTSALPGEMPALPLFLGMPGLVLTLTAARWGWIALAVRISREPLKAPERMKQLMEKECGLGC